MTIATSASLGRARRARRWPVPATVARRRGCRPDARSRRLPGALIGGASL